MRKTCNCQIYFCYNVVFFVKIALTSHHMKNQTQHCIDCVAMADDKKSRLQHCIDCVAMADDKKSRSQHCIDCMAMADDKKSRSQHCIDGMACLLISVN